jgi:hypothetical protein
LQPDQAAAQSGGDGLGDFGLAGAGLALKKQRAPEGERQKGDRPKAAPADIVLLCQERLNGVDGCGVLHFGSPLVSALRPELHGGAQWSRARA